MISPTISIRVPEALLECLPIRVRELHSVFGPISKNAYLVALIRSDLINPVNETSGLDVAMKQFWYHDKFDEKRVERWVPAERLKTPALLRRGGSLTI